LVIYLPGSHKPSSVDCLPHPEFQKVAKLLTITPAKRKHPRHQIDVRFVGGKYKAGEPAMVTLEIENVGKVPLSFQKGGWNRAARDNQFQFSAEKVGQGVPDIGTRNNHGVISVVKTIQPGEVFKQQVDLCGWFDLSELGWFQATGTYILHHHDEEFRGGAIWKETVAANFDFSVE